MKKIINLCGTMMFAFFMFFMIAGVTPVHAASMENVFVGDSRTVGMRSYVFGIWDDDQKYPRDEHGVWIAKCGSSNVWFMNTAVGKLQPYLNEGNKNYIICMGCNDMPDTNAADVYIRYLNANKTFFENNNIHVFFVSVNPVGHTKTDPEPHFINQYGQVQFTNTGTVEPFNAYLKSNLPSYVNYIDTYSYLVKNGYGTDDMLHMDNETNHTIYNLIVEAVERENKKLNYTKCVNLNVFDYEYYIYHNEDAKEYAGTDGYAYNFNRAFEYFCNEGIENGEQASPFFNINDYMELNPGVAEANGNDARECLRYYLNTGYENGDETLKEEHATIYYGRYYADKYPSLKDTYGKGDGTINWTGVLAHFLKYGMEASMQGSESFNVKAYKNNYKHLRTAFGTDIKKYYWHYARYGSWTGLDAVNFNKFEGVTVYNGIDYAAVYDFEYYRNKYSGVEKAYGDDDVATLNHFVRWGIPASYQGNEEFNVDIYKKNYPELISTYGNEIAGYYLHYIRWGKAGSLNASSVIPRKAVTVYNGIDYSAVYDFEYYRTKYPVVEKTYGDDDVATLKHFVRWGIPASYQGNEEFNVNIYKKNYPELVNAYGSEMAGYYLHYVRWGKAGGLNASSVVPRKPVTVYNGVDYSAVYDFEYYRTKYPGVEKTYGDDDVSTLAHFVKWGIPASYQGNEEFNVNIYKKNYPELINAYGSEMIGYYLHYVRWGKAGGLNASSVIPREPVTVYNGIDYSAVYDFEYYRTKYPGVEKTYGDDDVSTLAHFVKWGIPASYQGNEEFNVNIYKKNYPELISTYGSELIGYYLHYVRWGKAGGLNASTVIPRKPVTVYNGVDYSAVYDFEYYRAKYPGVEKAYGDDDVATLAHFVKWGIPASYQGNEEFNVKFYKINYPELVKTYKNTLAGYYLHYIRWGKTAGLNAKTLNK